MTTLHDFSVNSIKGIPTALSAYSGKVALIVNVASKCGLTPQYTALEALYRTYGARGFVVLGFPCNQFGGQEPGTEDEIQTFCSTKYDVTFPMFAKLDVNGDARAPLYDFLTGAATAPEGASDAGSDITWNFAKFLVDKQGKVIARFSPTEAPDSAKLTAAIEAAL
jgi:glutathione peroxidase